MIYNSPGQELWTLDKVNQTKDDNFETHKSYRHAPSTGFYQQLNSNKNVLGSKLLVSSHLHCDISANNYHIYSLQT